MCYAKPGPRCSNHALKNLQKAKSLCMEVPSSFDNFCALQKALQEFDTTSAGQKELRAEIELANNNEEKSILEERLNRGIETRKESLMAYQLARANSSSDKPTPIILAKNKLKEPNFSNVTYSVETDYDYYACEGCYGCDTGNDYCRGSRYEGLRITSVSVQSLLSGIFNCSINHIIPDLLKFAYDQDLDSPDSYTVYGEPDYYGETICVKMLDGKEKILKNWYFSQENASDYDGILEYCRSKGTVTENMLPIDAIKKQLAQENNGNTPPLVARTTNASTDGSVILSKIEIPNSERYDASAPLPAVTYGGANQFLGVLVRDENSGDHLVDGYHRFNSARTLGKRRGRFIILS